MTSLTISNKKYLLVEVPTDEWQKEYRGFVSDPEYIKWKLFDHKDDPMLNFYSTYSVSYGLIFNVILPFKCEIISLLKDLTEEQAASIVGTDPKKNFTSLELFDLWLIANGVDETRNHLILREI